MKDSVRKAEHAEQNGRSFTVLAERCPFPSVATNREGAVVFRNQGAKRLLPPVRRLEGILKEWKAKWGTDCLFCAKPWKENVFVLILSSEEGDVFSFLENPTHYRDVFFQKIFAEGAEVLREWQLWDSGLEEKSRRSSAEHAKLVARTQKTYERMTVASRLFNVAKRKQDELCSCSLQGFLELVARKLEEARIYLQMCLVEETAVYASPHLLLNALLSFVQFALLCGKEGEIKVNAKREGERLRLIFSVGKDLDVLRGMMLPTADEQEKILPLITAAMLCREYQTDFCIKDDGENVLFNLMLIQGDSEPEMFLGTDSGKEEQLVEAALREILFLNKKR